MKDLRTIDYICERLIKTSLTDNIDYVYMVLRFTRFMCSQSHLMDSSLYVRFIDNGFIVNLLKMIPILDGETSAYALFTLGNFIGCDFKSSGYLERSIYVKGLIFSKLPLFYDNVMKFITSSEKCVVPNFLFLFTQYLMLEEWRYCKSAVKSFLEDGTVYNVLALFRDVSCDSAEFYDGYICPVVDSFHQIFICVQGTIYEDQFCRIELKLLHRLAIQFFSTICKDPRMHTLTNVLSTLSHELDSAKPEDIQFYLDNKLYKKLVSTCVSYFNRKGDAKYSILFNSIMCLNTLQSAITNFEDKIKLRDVRSLIPLLPDLVDSSKKNGSGAPPNFFMIRIVLASSVLRRELKEGHYRELKQRNILSIIVENLIKFYDKDDMNIVLGLLPLMILSKSEKHVASWLSLSEIDKLLPCIPVVLKLLSSSCQSPSTYFQFMYKIARHDLVLTQICLSLINSLLRIKENRKHICIDSQLDALRKCNFISRLGQALIGAEDAPVSYEEVPVTNEKVPGVNEEIPGVNEEIHCLNEEIPGVNEGIHGVNEEIPGVNEEIPGVNEEIHGVNEEIPGVNEEIPGVNEEIPGVNEEIYCVNEEIPGVNEEIPGANEEIPGVNEEAPFTIVKARVTNEEAPVENEVMYILHQSKKLFGSFELMRGLCKMLPQLEKKQRKYIKDSVNDSDSIDGFGGQCFWIMRKAIAYIIDDLHPHFVRKIAIQVLNGWNTFMKSEGKMFFSSGFHTDEEESPNKSIQDESIVDVLRGTWWLIKKYPLLVNTYLPIFSPFFKVPSSDGDITDLASLTVIETIESYLENSQEISTEFLIELTNFVRDLSYDLVGSENEKQFRAMLLPACKLLLALNKNETITANLKLFIDTNSATTDDELSIVT